MDARSNYFPYHRADRYPRSLVTDWRRVRDSGGTGDAHGRGATRAPSWTDADTPAHGRPRNRPPRRPALPRARALPHPRPQAKPQTLKKYADCFELNLRPDLTPGETAIAVARCVAASGGAASEAGSCASVRTKRCTSHGRRGESSSAASRRAACARTPLPCPAPAPASPMMLASPRPAFLQHPLPPTRAVRAATLSRTWRWTRMRCWVGS